VGVLSPTRKLLCELLATTTTRLLISGFTVTRAEPVFGFCGALVLAVLQLGVRWRWVGPLLGQWPDFGG